MVNDNKDKYEKMDIKISCIIPYYNVDKESLFQCIYSILQQDFQDYEVILVDDGSEETYVTYLEEVCCLDSRIKLFHQKNQGASAARNNGMKHAKGDYITFVDADDMVVPFFFSEAYRVAEENHAEYVVGGILYTQSFDQKIQCVNPPQIETRKPDQYRSALMTITDLIEGGGHIGRGPVARLVNSNISKQVPFPGNVKIGEDVIWNLDVISRCKKIWLVYQVWYIYLENSKSLTHNYNENINIIAEEYLKSLIQRVDLENENEILAYADLVYEYLRRFIFGCYLGREECSLPLLKKAREFHKICQREPWNLYQSKLFLTHCSKKARVKHIMIKSGTLYWYFWGKDFFGKKK